jgi:hypothetical protein
VTESRVWRIPATQLTAIALACKSCGAETVLNIADDWQHRIADGGGRVLCGICQEPYDGAMRSALINFARWYSDLGKSAATAAFVNGEAVTQRTEPSISLPGYLT